MNVLIPMAGAGSRFQQEGYTTPKPLLDVLGKPMVVQAALSLPKGNRYIFVCRDFHVSEYQIDKELKKYFPNCIVITVDYLTEGQASTCLLAKEYINNDEPLMIGASDNGMIWNLEKFHQLIQQADCLPFSFRNNVTVVSKPQQYGWIIVDENLNVKRVSVKIPISEKPINDHAIVGAFWFRHGKDFVEAAERMIAKNRRINNEFYVDEAINEVVEAKKRVKVFEIDYYICWGTPNDYKTFHYWEEFFRQADFHPYGK
ncbi:MAG: glycosyltransferase family 2 protein [Cytophagales bacterium]|nr:glycosyltransferase family 2 protein [Cytophagales bacterium]MDW8383756.1 glycosyltransferase family 2 protein [Flammeovirgaceae bacterium]